MITFNARIQDGQVVLTPEQAAELGLREGDALTVRVERENRFARWIGVCPPLPDGQDSVSFIREMRDGDDV